jgi:excisionase family DNA binding protein
MNALASARRPEDPVVPTEHDTELARESGRLLAACIGQGDVARLVVHDGDQQIDVPVSALRMLVNILAQMAQGNAVSLVPFHAELTTQQAAGFLNVSRPYLVKLLERDVLKYRRVGTHRRIAFSELLQYRQRLTAQGRETAAKLSQEAEDLGLGY